MSANTDEGSGLLFWVPEFILINFEKKLLLWVNSWNYVIFIFAVIWPDTKLYSTSGMEKRLIKFLEIKTKRHLLTSIYRTFIAYF